MRKFLPNLLLYIVCYQGNLHSAYDQRAGNMVKRIIIVSIGPWSKPEVDWREPKGELIVIMIKTNVSFYAIGEDKVKKYILVQLFIAFLQSSSLPVSLTKTFL